MSFHIFLPNILSYLVSFLYTALFLLRSSFTNPVPSKLKSSFFISFIASNIFPSVTFDFLQNKFYALLFIVAKMPGLGEGYILGSSGGLYLRFDFLDVTFSNYLWTEYLSS